MLEESYGKLRYVRGPIRIDMGKKNADIEVGKFNGKE